jgi:four helix bundle protein
VANIRSFRDLIAYQKARALAHAVYTSARQFPSEERFELVPQIRRAANSVPLNIAEGFGVGTTAGTLRHLRIARGSLFEVDSAFDLASDRGYTPPGSGTMELLRETDRVLQGLIRSMESDPNA